MRTLKELETRYEKRKAWFMSMIGKRIYRGPVRCDCQSCTDVHLNGIVVADEMHADYLQACEAEMGLRYTDKRLKS